MTQKHHENHEEVAQTPVAEKHEGESHHESEVHHEVMGESIGNEKSHGGNK
jgi:hypothetical protein